MPETPTPYVLASVDADGSVRAMTLFEGEDPREIGETLLEHGSVPGRRLKLMTYSAVVTARIAEAARNREEIAMTDEAKHQDFFHGGQEPRPRRDWTTTRALLASPEGREPDLHIVVRPAAQLDRLAPDLTGGDDA